MISNAVLANNRKEVKKMCLVIRAGIIHLDYILNHHCIIQQYNQKYTEQ